MALLVQHGTVVGWSLTDPARYLTTGFAAPDPAPPAPATRLLLTECLDIITTPLFEGVGSCRPGLAAEVGVDVRVSSWLRGWCAGGAAH
ncbi:hypothetical protein AB0892_23880 [Streptomyces sp. NPDC005409]|uniref:hypothetical protein n=1 Tax=Streptomyces sp. NPDC005409 TaxID=3155342 RepID=UPI0034535484